MKDFKIIFACFGFLVGVFSFQLYQKVNFISLERPNSTSTRTIASSDEGLQKEIDSIRDRIIALRTNEDIDSFINYMITEKSKSKYPAVQMFVEFARPIPILKGIVWKLRGVVEKTDIAHTVALYYIRQFHHLRYIYGPHVTALLHYLTDPPADRKKYESISALQDDLLKFSSILERGVSLAEQGLKMDADKFHFNFDRAIFVGIDEANGKRFLDPDETEKVFIKPYLHYIISGLSRLIGGINYIAMYNLNDVPNIMKKILKKSAINHITGRFKIGSHDVPQIVTRAEIRVQIDKFKRTFLKARFDKNKVQEHLDKSFTYLAKAAQADLNGYICSIKYSKMITTDQDIPKDYNCSDFEEEMSTPGGFEEEEHFVVKGKNFLVDPNQLLLNHKRKFNELKQRNQLYKGSSDGSDVTIISDVTGKEIVMNVKAAFKAHDSLYKFLPASYEKRLSLIHI